MLVVFLTNSSSTLLATLLVTMFLHGPNFMVLVDSFSFGLRCRVGRRVSTVECHACPEEVPRIQKWIYNTNNTA
jgi:hypothetical protein